MQTYAAENNLFPENILKEIDQNERVNRKEMEEEEKSRAKRRLQNLLEKKNESNKKKAELRGLSAKNRISFKNKEDMRSILEELTNGELESFLSLKPKEWRHWLLRIVCLTDGNVNP